MKNDDRWSDCSISGDVKVLGRGETLGFEVKAKNRARLEREPYKAELKIFGVENCVRRFKELYRRTVFVSRSLL